MRARLLIALTLAASTLPAKADFAGCLAGIRSHAAGQGISGATFDKVMSGIEPDMKVIDLMNNQP